MSNIEQYFASSGGLGRRARQTGRAITRNQMGAAVRVSAVDAETDVTVAKIDNVTMATGSAARAVVQVAQLQQALEQLVPGVSNRLAFLADDHALGMGELLADLRRDLRRA